MLKHACVTSYKGLEVQDELAYQEIRAFQMIFAPYLVKNNLHPKSRSLPAQTGAHAADAVDIMLHNGPKKRSQNQGQRLFLATFEGNRSKGQECSPFSTCSPASACSLRAVSSCMAGAASPRPPSAHPRMLTLAWMDAAQYPCQPKQCVNVSPYVISTIGVFLDAISTPGNKVQNQKAFESLWGLERNPNISDEKQRRMFFLIIIIIILIVQEVCWKMCHSFCIV